MVDGKPGTGYSKGLQGFGRRRRGQRGQGYDLVRVDNPDDLEQNVEQLTGDERTLIGVDSPDDADLYLYDDPPPPPISGNRIRGNSSR